MAVGLPLKTTYANGDVYSASDVNDTNGTINQNVNPFVAGKNKVINGDFNVNQRAFTSNTTSGLFNFDRWFQINSGGSFTVTPQTFTPGAAPVAGYEGRTFFQGITASQSAAGDFAILDQKIESVRTLAGSTATISFWAKASSGTPKIGIELGQYFGTGGSPSASVFTACGAVTTSTSWARYSVTVAVPSISGKTIGTNNDHNLELLLWVSAGATYASRASSIGVQNNTFQIWGVQVEQSSTATPFQTASGTIGGELALCQRYYNRIVATGANFAKMGTGQAPSTTTAQMLIPFPVEMRTVPTSVDFSGLGLYDGGLVAVSNVTLDGQNPRAGGVACTSTGLTTARAYILIANNNANAFLGFSAEL
jgi:hypothetical protein